MRRRQFLTENQVDSIANRIISKETEQNLNSTIQKILRERINEYNILNEVAGDTDVTKRLNAAQKQNLTYLVNYILRAYSYNGSAWVCPTCPPGGNFQQKNDGDMVSNYGIGKTTLQMIRNFRNDGNCQASWTNTNGKKFNANQLFAAIRDQLWFKKAIGELNELRKLNPNGMPSCLKPKQQWVKLQDGYKFAKMGHYGQLVKNLQQRLNKVMLTSNLGNTGYKQLKVDGYFGQKMKDGVVLFQRSRGISPDGVIGANTYKELYKPLPGEKQAGAAIAGNQGAEADLTNVPNNQGIQARQIEPTQATSPEIAKNLNQSRIKELVSQINTLNNQKMNTPKVRVGRRNKIDQQIAQIQTQIKGLQQSGTVA